MGLEAVDWVALLDPVGEPDLGRSRVLVGHLELACGIIVGALQVFGH